MKRLLSHIVLFSTLFIIFGVSPAEAKPLDESMVEVVMWFFDFAVPFSAEIFQNLVDPVFKLGAVFFLVILLWTGLKVLAFPSAEVEHFVSDLFKKFIAFIFMASLSSVDMYPYLVDTVYEPVINSGFQVSSNIMKRAGDYDVLDDITVGGDGSVSCGAPISKLFLSDFAVVSDKARAALDQQRGAFMCQLRLMLKGLGFGLQVATMLLPNWETDDSDGKTITIYGWNDSCEQIGSVVVLERMISFIILLISALILMFVYGFLILALPIYVMLMLFRLFIITIITPFTILAFIIPQVRGVVGIVIKTVISQAFIFIGWAAVIALGLGLLDHAINLAMQDVLAIINTGDYAGSFGDLRSAIVAKDTSEFVAAFGNQQSVLKAATMSIATMSWWLLLCSGLLIYVLMNSASQLARMVTGLENDGMDPARGVTSMMFKAGAAATVGVGVMAASAGGALAGGAAKGAGRAGLAMVSKAGAKFNKGPEE
jgi:hypothetical protein